MGSRFATTRWTTVLAVAATDQAQARAALSDLCQTYAYPIYTLIRRQVRDADKAADLTQGFLVHVIENDALRRVRPSQGRFRAFLVAAVRNFLANERDREAALKRGGRTQLVPFDLEQADRRFGAERNATWDPERCFERQWAVAVLERALERLRVDCARAGKDREFSCLKGVLTGEHGGQTYKQIAVSLATTEAAVKTAVHRMRKRYGQALREEIAATVDDPADVDAEVRYLLSALSE